jgi:hypothetical protein
MFSNNTINNNNQNITNNTLSKLQNFNKQEDSKLETYILRKQMAISLSNCFMPTKMEKVNFIPSLKSNLKGQVEELKKLQSEVLYMEYKIRDLELAKKIKQTKV